MSKYIKTLQQKHEFNRSLGMNAYRKNVTSDKYKENYDKIFNKDKTKDSNK